MLNILPDKVTKDQALMKEQIVHSNPVSKLPIQSITIKQETEAGEHHGLIELTNNNLRDLSGKMEEVD